MRVLRRATPALLLPALAAGCGDDLGPGRWEAAVDTVSLYSLARADLQGLPAAFDFVGLRLVVVEAVGATGVWDLGISERDGEFVLLPPGALPGVAVSAAIAVLEGEAFEELARAPADTADYTTDEALPLETDRVYVVRSHLNPNLGACVYFAKVEVTAVDPTIGRVAVRYTRNPFCNDRRLVPPGGD